MRLDRARELLERGEGSVARVAHRCGFDDSKHFARSFRRAFGASPSSLRRA